MGLTLRRGLLRFVGGTISKKKPVRVTTPVGVLGVRGGIALIEVIDQDTVEATFLFGEDLVVWLDGREVARIRRPGFSTRLTRTGVSPICRRSARSSATTPRSTWSPA